MALEYHLNIKDNGTAVFTKVGQKVNALHQNLTLTEQTLNVFNKGLTKTGAAFAGWASIGMAKGTAMLKDLAKEMVNSYDSAVKLSGGIGVSADSIIGLRYAAEQSSVGAEAMDKNMAKLSKAITNAAEGSKQASDTFAKMGISVKNTDGSIKNSEQVLYEMADAFQKLPAGSQRATLAVEMFGKAGVPMVQMLKDGSAGLKEMASEGTAAAGNIESISKSMTDFNTATTRSKAAMMGLMASLSDSSTFSFAISSLDTISKKMMEITKASKEAAGQEREDFKDTLQRNAYMEISLDKQKDAGTMTKEIYKERLEALNKENIAIQMKNKLTSDEIELAQAKGELEYLNDKQQMHGLDSFEAMRVKDHKETIARIANRQKAITDEKAANAAALADFDKNQNAKNESEKRSLKLFEEAMRKKEAAIKSLADFDEKARMASLEGEDLLAAKYELQLEQLNELHATAETSEADHVNRLLGLHTQYENDLRKMQKETADKREENIKKLADFDERMRIAGLEGEAQKIAQLEYNHQRQLEEANSLLEARIAENENDIVLREEHNARIKEMEAQLAKETGDIKKDYSDKEKKRLEEERDIRLNAMSSTMNALQQVGQAHSDFAALYKASAIGEATINAYQSILKTMSSVPFPFNVPLAAAQGAAAAVQVSNIASTKMFAGGMIPGRNTLIMANEEGPEALLNTRAVREVGGPAGVNALNRGHTYNSTVNNSRTSDTSITINAPIMTQQAWRNEIEPVMKRANRRR
ncbi:MAG: hypothetical protein FWB90_02825 [Fibromonadales bacterium]|nr:hypothetical protein [Fibromonadales bacterium]